MDFLCPTKFSTRRMVRPLPLKAPFTFVRYSWHSDSCFWTRLIGTGEYVAQFQTTIALTKNGTVRLAGPAPLNTDKIKSEKKLEDETLLKLIAEPLKPGKTKNKKKKKTGEGKEEGEEEK
jgi:hypothetical protein